jgi:AAA+ superfamily predicted ATPase
MRPTEAGATSTVAAILDRVRSRARLSTAWMERLWSEGQTSPDQGLAITPGEVHGILADQEADATRYHHFRQKGEAAQLEQASVEADEKLACDEFWTSIAERFGLKPRECDLLCLAIAVDLDPRLGRVLAYLADDTRANQPTASGAARLFAWQDRLPSPMSGLIRWRLAQPAAGEAAWRSTTPWQADQAVILSVMAGRWVDPAMDRWVQWIEPLDAKNLPCLYPEVLDAMLAEPLVSWDGEVEVALTGPEGSGRQTLAAQFAAVHDRPLLAVKTPTLLSAAGTAPGAAADAIVRSARLAHARSAVLYWRDAETVPAADWMEVRALTRLSFRGAETEPATATHRFALSPLSTARRLEAWRFYSDTEPPLIVRIQRLTPAEVRRASEAASEAALQMALRREIKLPGDLLRAVPCPYTWDDLVLPPHLERLLHDLEAQVRLRWEVYEEWGFARLTHLGQGISALFGGPSGTGKTMAAQVLGRSLGMALYRVDLAGVVNKYVGETEKRLRDVFDACERSGALLFFDEADALFGSRMQVKDAHDRFANIEIDYLLQRIEQFDGIAILATNRKNDLDAAFLRRLRFVVDFLSPGREERRLLWEKALPEFSPSGERIVGEIDYIMLAREMEVNGAQIKAIALGAAFLARSEGKLIGHHEIERSAEREYAKQGLLLRPSFGRPARI